MTTYTLPNHQDFMHTIDGKNTHIFHFTNTAGMKIALSDYGARLVSALIPNKFGELVDVVLGFNTIQGYLSAKEVYHGATIGRFANRIANGTFELNGTTYQLAQNNGNNNLHGGPNGFHHKVWDRQISSSRRVDFYYTSPNGEEGFPGEVKVNTSYELTTDNQIVICFRATSDQHTVLNLTNHAYFNLNGEGSGNILDHFIKINSDKFVPLNDNQIPIALEADVANTPFDFRKAKKLADIIDFNHPQIKLAKGYDHSFVNSQGLEKPIASAYSEESGILLEVYSDLPALHLYTGNYLADDLGKSGKNYVENGGFCFEAQYFPDSPNQKQFPSVVIGPGKDLYHRIKYKFSLIK